MTEPRNEFDFEQWYKSPENRHVYYPETARAGWHAAIDSIRAKLASKELWIAPMNVDEEMLKAAADGDRAYTTRVFGEEWATMAQGAEDHWSVMRDSYLAYYGSSFGLEP